MQIVWLKAAPSQRSQSAVVTWRAILDGHQFDLETLIELFPFRDPLIGNESGQWFVYSSEIDGPDGQPDSRAARALVDRLNGIARAADGGYRPVEVTDRYLGPDGAAAAVIGALAIEGRSRVSVSGAVVSGDPTPLPTVQPTGQRYAQVLAADPDAAEAVRTLGQAANLDWMTLYKIWEIIDHAFGGWRPIANNGWATKADIDRFTASANHPHISRDAARQAEGQATWTRSCDEPDGGREVRAQASRGLDWIAPGVLTRRHHAIHTWPSRLTSPVAGRAHTLMPTRASRDDVKLNVQLAAYLARKLGKRLLMVETVISSTRFHRSSRVHSFRRARRSGSWDTDWCGGWGNEPLYHAPAFVHTHYRASRFR